ncbi:MAG: PA0069 family radical SAM protein [Rhizobiaceae bacterium]|nr:PA0069 family radical SAM protein [Rhizobiaceae bacterium]
MSGTLDTVQTADQQAFAPIGAGNSRGGADFANGVINRSGIRVGSQRMRGRAAAINPAGRFETSSRHLFDDGWQTLDELPPFKTQVTAESPRTIVTRNDSPDLPFDRSINPYRGCEHGCVYCFARPTHSYMGLSAGLDFESKLYAKPNAAKLLHKELAAADYKVKSMAMGTNTDPYQPIEKQWRITRDILEVLEETNHPVGIVTKSALVTRDIDILSRMAAKGLARVAISITSLDRKLSRAMEPRAATPTLRLDTLRQLSDAGIPTSVMVAPIIPALTDHELERILDAAKANGALDASYILLRLPHEVSGLFKEWLLRHYPDRYTHVLSLMRSMRGGKDYQAEWGTRMRGVGPYAWQVQRRFDLATRKIGLQAMRMSLRSDLFKPPTAQGAQLSLF